MALNTSQLVSGAGAVAEARREHEGVLQDLHEKQLELEAKNRRVDPELRQRRIDRARKGLEGIETTGMMEPGEMPEPEKKAGLSTGTRTATSTAAASTGAPTTGKAGLKTEEEGKTSSSYGGIKFPKDMEMFVNLSFEKGELTQGENETNIKFGVRNFLHKLEDKVQQAIGTADAKSGIMLPGDSGSGTSPFRQKVSEINTFTGTPADMKKAGFKSREEVTKFNSDRNRLKEEIHQWFGKRPGAIKQFQELPIHEQVQTFKAIMGDIEKNIDADSGLSKEVEAEAETTASTVKAAKQKAGLPATSAIEEEKPSKQKTILLEGDRGAPRDKALDLKNQYEELSMQMQEEIWIGDADSQKNVTAIRKEMAVLKEAYDHALGVQGTQDFVRTGDARMMQGIMNKKYGSEVYLQELPNGNYNIVERDAKSGELVPVHSDVTKDAVVASFRNLTDEQYKKAYQQVIAKRAELTMQLEFDSALEQIKHKFGMERDQFKAWADAQVAAAKGEDIEWYNAKIDGEDQFVVRRGGRFFMVTPPVKTKVKGMPSAPGMVEIDPPF